jgi:hypothetical protein
LRSFKHGGDGRFAQDGSLECRLTGFCVTELSCSAITGLPNRPSVRGEDLLERGAENGSVPPECEDLLLETVLLDPGAAVAAAHVAHAVNVVSQEVLTTARNFSVEQTAWWAVRDPRVDTGELVARSGITGLLPSPVAVTPPTRPWNPIHLDWRIQFVPAPLGEWSLDEIDFHHTSGALPATDDATAGFVLEGRAHLTGGAAATIAAGVRSALAAATSVAGATALDPTIVSRFHSADASAILNVLAEANVALVESIVANRGDGGVLPVDRSALADIATALEHMDVLAGAMDNFVTRLRGDVPGDGTSTPPGGPLPSPFLPLRSGFMRILRLRLVDGFGQARDLAGSSDTTIVDAARLSTAEPMQVPRRGDLQAMPPRFTSPSRLWLRFMDATGGAQEASSTVSPVCGYLMPNHLDGDLEFFDVDGQNLGVVRPDPAAGVVWEDAPGRPSTVGQLPSRAIDNSFLAGIAQGLLDWGTADAIVGGRETALAAMLRIIDSTLWSVDPFGHTGDEHLALLVGHPVAVLRARVQLEVREPVQPADLLNQLTASVRLGALTHWQDGLLGYFVNDDYRTLYCADAAVAGFARQVGPGEGFLQPANLVPNFYETFADDIGAGAAQGSTPVTHPYVNDSGLLTISPHQDIMLTLLLEPHSVVHATTGLLPRKEIGMRREWVAGALAKLSPTFRFGPVLVDPKHIRMPVPTERSGTWSWDHRADIVNWQEDPVTNATADAQLPPDPAQGTEGWLRLVPTPPPAGG